MTAPHDLNAEVRWDRLTFEGEIDEELHLSVRIEQSSGLVSLFAAVGNSDSLDETSEKLISNVHLDTHGTRWLIGALQDALREQARRGWAKDQLPRCTHPPGCTLCNWCGFRA